MRNQENGRLLFSSMLTKILFRASIPTKSNKRYDVTNVNESTGDTSTGLTVAQRNERTDQSILLLMDGLRLQAARGKIDLEELQQRFRWLHTQYNFWVLHHLSLPPDENVYYVTEDDTYYGVDYMP
ncbi:hypothetical protein K7X08_037249 [Anisodus acutangulus]|uniref:Uncharacterized protein n=1 Tax=Anisodus acutangulus TaxID=402998 RepID=A0A9Q1MWL3_9SOLA|nr:hypothetical protein K7X08_037249 [Anisodus acutangulus]